MGCCNSNIVNQNPVQSRKTSISSLGSQKNLKLRPRIPTRKGQIRDTYEIILIINSEGFGTVFKAIEKRSGFMRAIKEIQKSKLDLNSEEQMLWELELLRSLRHPNIIKIFEVVESEFSYYIVTELLMGGELSKKILSEIRLGEKLAAKYTQEIMTAVNYSHSNSVTFGCLKPEMLLFETKDPDAPLKITDFGVTQKPSEETNFFVKSEGIYYQAPEVFSGIFDSKCDIWSVGIIIYFMLCGRPPFVGSTPQEVIGYIKKGNIDLSKGIWNHVSQEAKDLLRKTIEIDPEKRISAQEVLDHPWIKKHISNEIEDVPLNHQIFEQLCNFRAKSKLDKRILAFIAARVQTFREESELRKLFKSLDTNGDGVISRHEILEGSKLLATCQQIDLDQIIENCDSDNSGRMDYSDFLVASINWSLLFQKQEFEKAFQAYNITSDGYLSLNELKRSIFRLEEAEWEKFSEEIDKSHLGIISVASLKDYLLKHLSSR